MEVNPEFHLSQFTSMCFLAFSKTNYFTCMDVQSQASSLDKAKPPYTRTGISGLPNIRTTHLIFIMAFVGAGPHVDHENEKTSQMPERNKPTEK